MGEYEPDDSRDVTLNPNEAPGEPPRTGPREGEARAEAAIATQAGEGSDREPARDEAVARKDAQDAAREGGPARET